MDEHTNDSNKPDDVISPDSTNEEQSSSVESEAEEAPKEVSGVPSVPEGEASSSDGGNSSSEEAAPEGNSETPQESGGDSGGQSEAPVETSDKPEETPAESVPGETSAPAETPAEPAASATPVAPSIPADESDSSSSEMPKLPIADKPKNKMMMVVIIVLVVVVLAAAAIVYAMSKNKKTTPPATTTTSTSTTTTGPKTDTWTGKANTYDWNTATNWSAGVPVTGENVVINVASVKQPTGGTGATFNNNVPTLSINKLTVNGTGLGFNVKGNPLTITGGLVADITATSNTASPPQVQFVNSIVFTGNQAVQTMNNDELFFTGATTSSTVSIGTSTVQFIAAKSSDMAIDAPIVGSGEIDIPASTSTTGNVDFNTASPNFSGKVLINDGATAGLSNQNPNGTGVNSVDAFGTGSITVASGGFLELNETGSNTLTVPNDITVGGNGAVSPSKDNGDNTGAVTVCITSAQQGCGAGATVNFTGTITLTGNASFGAYYGNGSAQVPPSTTVTYVVKTLTAGGHTLTAVTSSKAIVQLPKS